VDTLYKARGYSASSKQSAPSRPLPAAGQPQALAKPATPSVTAPPTKHSATLLLSVANGGTETRSPIRQKVTGTKSSPAPPLAEEEQAANSLALLFAQSRSPASATKRVADADDVIRRPNNRELFPQREMARKKAGSSPKKARTATNSPKSSRENNIRGVGSSPRKTSSPRPSPGKATMKMTTPKKASTPGPPGSGGKVARVGGSVPGSRSHANGTVQVTSVSAE